MVRNTDSQLSTLLERAERRIEEGRLEEALELARQARTLSDHPDVLLLVGGILAELGRIDEAIPAFEEVLEKDRNHLEAMGALADLLINGGSDDPEAIERGLALCRKAAPLAKDDPEYAAELALLEGIALSTLGAFRDALAAFDRAAQALGDDPELLQERGIALFHLWRIDEARACLERVVEIEPEAPWALHYLAVIADRNGEREKADAYFRRAHEADPEGMPLPFRIPENEFDQLVEEAISQLPEKVRRYLANVAIAVEAYPQESEFGGDEEVSPSVLGVFRGSPLGEKATFDPWSHFPNSILLFQRSLENSVGSREELVDEIGVTLLHEVGHFLGLDEDDLRDMDLD
ncbi:MAG TPA: metallopeptidase family protein [Fredinandcohnia sp.]|nr:metallopeptidase family protein [Fredinandcohnia sp.]